jgi:hypothetical protein
MNIRLIRRARILPIGASVVKQCDTKVSARGECRPGLPFRRLPPAKCP